MLEFCLKSGRVAGHPYDGPVVMLEVILELAGTAEVEILPFFLFFLKLLLCTSDVRRGTETAGREAAALWDRGSQAYLSCQAC